MSYFIYNYIIIYIIIMDLINYNITNIGQNGDYNTSFIIDKCQNKINNEINSKNQWLYFMEIIQNIKGKEIITLKGVIDKKKQVVLKIQNFQLGEKEFNIQEKLSNYNGFIKFYCHFSCNINPKFYNGTYIKVIKLIINYAIQKVIKYG